MQYQRLTARQLGAVNDSACSLIVDPYVGVNSRKLFHRPPVKDQSKLKHIVQKLVDGKVNEDQALKLLFDRGEAKRKARQLTDHLLLSEEQIGQYYKLYLTAFRNAPNFKLEPCPYFDSKSIPSNGKQDLRVIASRSFNERDIIPALVGIFASTDNGPASSNSKHNKGNSKKSNFQYQHLSRGATTNGDGGGSQAGYLLLGPAAFVNHCCEPNASFRRMKEANKVILSAVRNIKAGDEITVSYGYDYSRENDGNNSCECSKCLQRNKSP